MTTPAANFSEIESGQQTDEIAEFHVADMAMKDPREESLWFRAVWSH